MKRFYLLPLVYYWPSLARACEGCKMSSINGFKETQTLQAGIALSWSVLFLLAFVFLLLGILCWAIRSACLQADKAHRLQSRVKFL
ncbi:MAG: hypothetical protein QE493_07390 [Verrucomicrobiae bacterium]|jgi:hypothetical protein|nr:hypothetical protein [Verrucomicrobiae bacterium]